MSKRLLLHLARAVLRDRRGATAVEYALICALMVLVMLVALRNVADATIGMWNYVAAEVIAKT